MREDRISNVLFHSPSPTFPLIIIFLGLIVISMPLQNAFAVDEVKTQTDSSWEVGGIKTLSLVVILDTNSPITSITTSSLEAELKVHE